MIAAGQKVLVKNHHNEFYTVGHVVRGSEGVGTVVVSFEHGGRQLLDESDVELIPSNPCQCFCHERVEGANHTSRCVCNGGWGYL